MTELLVIIGGFVAFVLMLILVLANPCYNRRSRRYHEDVSHYHTNNKGRPPLEPIDWKHI